HRAGRTFGDGVSSIKRTPSFPDVAHVGDVRARNSRSKRGAAMQPVNTLNSATESLPSAAPLTELEAAVRLGLKVSTLRAWRHYEKGPHSSGPAARFDI